MRIRFFMANPGAREPMLILEFAINQYKIEKFVLPPSEAQLNAGCTASKVGGETSRYSLLVHRLRIAAGHWIVHMDQVRVDALYQRVDLPRAGNGPVDRLSVEIRSGERHFAADEAGCGIALETVFRDPALSVADEDDLKTGGHQSAAEEHQVRLRCRQWPASARRTPPS